MSLTNRRITRVGIFGLALIIVAGFKALLTLILGYAPHPVNLWVTVVAYGLGIGMILWSLSRRLS